MLITFGSAIIGHFIGTGDQSALEAVHDYTAGFGITTRDPGEWALQN